MAHNFDIALLSDSTIISIISVGNSIKTLQFSKEHRISVAALGRLSGFSLVDNSDVETFDQGWGGISGDEDSRIARHTKRNSCQVFQSNPGN